MSRITPERFIVVAGQMRKSKNFLLDISKYNEAEVAMITVLVQNDAIFNFFNSVRNMDLRKIKAIMEFLDAKEKMNTAIIKFGNKTDQD